ncbi:rhodanese domain protein [Isorropodon fossajaponicum endosymbiont JTNG4]|uniref:rhodanese-like domain-containing protein n=1 Tax=Isorropodon fossajaponicum symbiont TaxID=883811 RepID=UPI0019166ACF|nr:rhodanese-like domain-containing protein [Isorropodon fossajaponicum symbiont]BBB24492.1 rhodanese domain protein [Isorropodon fossajaponicum endosymbiont JTNG4]
MNQLIQHLPKKAFERLQVNQDAILIDVRCEAENKFVGRPIECIFVSWLDDPDWEPNEDEFIAAIKRLTGKENNFLEREIILICRSGYRSNDAGKCLIEHGFTNVAHVVSGFEGDLDVSDQRGNLNGWRYDGMPWLQC